MKVEDHHRTILDMKIKKALNPFYHKNIFDRSNNRRDTTEFLNMFLAPGT